MTKASVIGTGFEYRVRDHLIKLEYHGVKRQALSGASMYQEDKGDLLATWKYEDILEYPFLVECKKSTKKHKFDFDTYWEEETDMKGKKMHPVRIPIIMFSGQNMDIYTMIKDKIYYKIFGNYPDMVLKEFRTRGKRYFTINWNEFENMIKGQVNQQHMLRGIKVVMATEQCYYVFKINDLTNHLNKFGDMMQNTRF